ncbi:MAG: TolC family protein [Betaproteobacteria bacterium]
MHVIAKTFAAASLAVLALGAGAQPLSLEEAVRSGLAQSPRLAAQRHMVDAAREQVGRAGELPDPKLRLGIENLPVTGEDRLRYDRDFMTARAIGWTQEFPNSAKREARNLRAERARGVEGANLAAQEALLQRDIATSWLELHYAERSRAALERLAGQFRLHLDSLSPAIARGRQGAADAFMLRQAFEQANDKLLEQERAVEKARIMLASWLGEAAKRPLADPPDTTAFAQPRHELVARLAEHPELRTFDRREALARAEVDLATSMKKSDWMLEVGYGQRRPYFENMLTVMVAFDLPWRAERRQDRDVASRLAELEQTRAMREDARRMREAEVRGWLADFDTAQRRIERFERTLLPLARDRVTASLAAYRGGRSELGAVLESERMVTENELGLIQALAERAKAWANLSYLYPQESTR